MEEVWIPIQDFLLGISNSRIPCGTREEEISIKVSIQAIISLG